MLFAECSYVVLIMASCEYVLFHDSQVLNETRECVPRWVA